MSFHEMLKKHLITLESAMKAAKLWSDAPPTKQEMSSTTPFCVDTMPFEDWCQWIFIPQLDNMLKKTDFKGLNTKCDTATMGDFVFSQRSMNEQQHKHIINALKQVDSCLNDQLPTKH